MELNRETEIRVHEALYTNLLLLKGFYPTRKEFDVVFKKNMFVKNNKAACLEVIYYLLHILNPEVIKTHLPSWPPFKETEAKCRSEIIAYINSLNSVYESADIPSCQPSSLISPGGFRFAKFILKISQLVIYEHLKKLHGNDLLLPIKSQRNMPAVSIVQRNNLEKETKLIEKETKELLQNFDKLYSDVLEKSEKIQKSLEQLNIDICNARNRLEKSQEEFGKKYPSYPSVSSLEEKLIALKQQTEKIVVVDQLFSSSEKLLGYLMGSASTLEHSEENFTVPSDIAHIITNRKELNLSPFFQGLTVLLEKKALQLQYPSPTCIKQTKEALQNHSLKYEMVLSQIQSQQEHINNLLDSLRGSLTGVTKEEK